MINYQELADEVMCKVVKKDIEINFNKIDNDFSYNKNHDMITLPSNFKMREINRHHICWIKRYGLDLMTYTDKEDQKIAYYIFCICHEVGHYIHKRIDADNEYLKYIEYAEYIAEDWDMYRNIFTEQLADEYACTIFNARKDIIDKLIEKYKEVKYEE